MTKRSETRNSWSRCVRASSALTAPDHQWYQFNGNVWQLDECLDAANSPDELIRLYGDECERVTAHLRELTESGHTPNKSLAGVSQ